tara:strand:+ start:36993 stop:37334 length:342 start_codon:yes stop_codon:yes gene_type:complete
LDKTTFKKISIKTVISAKIAALLINRKIDKNEEEIKKQESILRYLLFELKSIYIGIRHLERIEKDEIFTFPPNPLNSLDLSKKLPFIITESNIIKLIKKDSMNIAIIERDRKK